VADGNCRAVLTFLEDFCGVRWFLPGPEGEFVPKTADISVPAHLAKTVNPAFADGKFPFGSKGKWLDNITPAAIANNFQKGVAVEPGGHSYGHLVPAEGYFKDNPELLPPCCSRKSNFLLFKLDEHRSGQAGVRFLGQMDP